MTWNCIKIGMKIKFKLIYLEYFEYSIYLKAQLMFALTPYKLYSLEFHTI